MSEWPKPFYLERWLTWLAYVLSRSRLLAPLLIWIHRQLFTVNLEEAEFVRASQYPTFLAYFTRRLKPGARPMPEDPRVLVAPCDGTLGAEGRIVDDTLMQAKGYAYSLRDLICDDGDRLMGGHYMTLYLGPADYHRIHAPTDMRVVGTQYVGGRLFSVKEAMVQSVPRLFTRNERLIIHGQADFGPLIIVLVGAQLVSGIHVLWEQGARVKGRGAGYKPLAEPARFERGEEMGHFIFGSTAILLLPPGVSPTPFQDRRVWLGQVVGQTEPGAEPVEAGATAARPADN